MSGDGVVRTSSAGSTGATRTPATGDPSEEMNALGLRLRDELLARVPALEHALVALLEGDLDSGLRRRAEREAHRLAGAAGTLGYPRASLLAADLEARFAGTAPIPLATVPRAAELVEELRAELERRPRPIEPTPPVPPGPEPPPGPGPLGCWRLLVVDDDPTVLAIVEAVLGPAGASVTGASDAGGFWEALEHDPPDLVLLDLDLPGTSGAELCRQLRGDPCWVRLPVVFLSAHTGPAAVEAIFSAGADDLLAKPVRADDLVNRVTGRLRRMRALAGPEGGTVSGPASAADVVVVEDDDIVAELVEHALGGAGYRTCRLQDGSAAAEALASGALRGTPLVLLDISLPGLDGFGVLEHLRRAGALATTRVLVLTARSSETEVLRALELGALDHVAKPFSVPVLMERVRRALAR